MTDKAGREGEAQPLYTSPGAASPPKPLPSGSARDKILTRIKIEELLGDYVHKVGKPVWVGSRDFPDLDSFTCGTLGHYLHYNLYGKTKYGKRIIISDRRVVPCPHGGTYNEYLLKPIYTSKE